MASEWEYLLTDVYRVVDVDGPLRRYEGVREQWSRFQALTHTAPSLAAALASVGRAVESAAADGDLAMLHEQLMELRQDEVLYYYWDRAFRAATLRGQLHVCEYMRRRGYWAAPDGAPDGHADGQMNPIITRLVTDVLTQCAATHEVRTLLPSTSTSASASAAAIGSMLQPYVQLSDSTLLPPSLRPRVSTGGGAVRGDEVGVVEAEEAGGEAAMPPLPAPPHVMLAYLLRVAAFGMNYQRTPDGWTPLHLAASLALPATVALLLALGADVNAVSSDDLTPLAVAEHAQRDAAAEEAAAAAAAPHTRGAPEGSEKRWRGVAPLQHEEREAADTLPLPDIQTSCEADCELCIRILRSHGAVRTWQEACASVAPRTAACGAGVVVGCELAAPTSTRALVHSSTISTTSCAPNTAAAITVTSASGTSHAVARGARQLVTASGGGSGVPLHAAGSAEGEVRVKNLETRMQHVSLSTAFEV